MDNKKKLLIIAATIAAAGLIGISIYLFIQLQTTETQMVEMVEMLEYEKEELEEEYADIALEMEGFTVKTDNDSILRMLDKEQQRVQLLLQELRTVKATNARRIKELKTELASVRKVLVYYVAQVDSLNAVNKILIDENREVKQQYSEVTQRATILEEEKQTLEEKVTIASQLEASNILFSSRKKRGSTTKYVRYSAYFQIEFTLNKNITTKIGEKTAYIRITTPENTILQKSPSNTFSFEDSQIAFSAKKTFDFGGEAINQTIYYNIDETLIKGDYRADIFIDSHLVGSQTLSLR